MKSVYTSPSLDKNPRFVFPFRTCFVLLYLSGGFMRNVFTITKWGWILHTLHTPLMRILNLYFLFEPALVCFTWAEGLFETTSLLSQDRDKVCVDFVLPRPHGWDYTWIIDLNGLFRHEKLTLVLLVLLVFQFSCDC